MDALRLMYTVVAAHPWIFAALGVILALLWVFADDFDHNPDKEDH